ncbi:uncharacterized protein LOC135462226 [Liolophura sinensis]|uniref:uncharacterized protein LOC135462226 n=1 Tax=Liolophura sinensis TaxID=3198878 RepID=UPI003158629D
MLKYVAFFALLGFAWSQSSPAAQATAMTAAPVGSTAPASPYKFFYDKFYHQIVMMTSDSCYFHQLSREERYDAQDAAGLKAIETKILAAEKKLEEFGTETQSNLHFYSYSFEIRQACRDKDTYKISSSG